MVADRRRSMRSSSSSSDFARVLREVRDEAPRQVGVSQGDEGMSAAKFFIQSLPGLPAESSLQMWAGHIPSAPPVGGVADTTSDAHLFFFLVRNRHIADTERTVIWFNGGPGCSSFDGSLMEVGPLRLVPGAGGELKETEGAWNEYANILFVDQPVGTGYSYVSSDGYIHELGVAAAHVVQFLSVFYTVFPEFTHHDTYLAGESYAGQYIPYIADAVLASAQLPTRLKGLLIGNGWIDPINQYPAYLDFALQAGVVKKGSQTESNIRKDVESCLAKLTAPGETVRIHNGGCENILGSITDSTVQSVNGQNICVNNYDVRLTDTHPACGMNWPPDLADITPYLQRSDVKAAFHAARKDGGWVECSGNVGANFWVQHSEPSVNLLPKLLEQIPILFFAGDQDLICNYVGIERMIDSLTWNGQQGFGNVTEQEWWVDGRNAGTWTSARGLTYVRVAEASHMVPYDQPLAAHDMFLRFVGADLLGAAGPAAQVPSRVGDELEAVLGETHPNGTAVSTGSGDSVEVLPDEAFSKASTIDAIVNAGSAIVLIFLLVLGFATVWMVRRRRSRRRGKAPALGHTRGGSGRSHTLPQEDVDGPHELDELVVGGDYGGESSADDREAYPGDRKSAPPPLRTEEEIFGLGSDDEDSGSGRKGGV